MPNHPMTLWHPISEQRLHISSTPEVPCWLKGPHSCSVAAWSSRERTHKLTDVQWLRRSSVSCEKSRWKVTSWCQIRHGFEPGPLGARSDTLEGHVFPLLHLRWACEPREIFSRPRVPLPPPWAQAGKERREWKRERRKVCVKERKSERGFHECLHHLNGCAVAGAQHE